MNEKLNFVLAVSALFIALVATCIVLCSEGMNVPVDDNPLTEFLPVNTEARMVGFTNELIGFPCEGLSPDGFPLTEQSTLIFESVADEYGYFGARGTTLLDGVPKIVQYTELVECRTTEEWYDVEQTKPKSGHMVFQLMFDPNNGWIQQQQCDYFKYPAHCPKDDNGNFVFIGRQSPLDNPDSETYQTLPYTGN